jgi:glycerophosphoryl diester phosphodiesterase
VLQSFNPATVERVKLLAPGLPTALLIGQLPTTPSRVRARRLVQQVLQVGANALASWHATLTPPFLEEMRKRGVAVWAWTVDEDIVMRDLAMMGVQGIITNYPDRLNLVLDDLVEDGQLQPPLGRRQRLKRSRWGRRRQLRKLKAAKKNH